ncbi:MAG TPA: hypothetical protein VH682_00125 [Gemmataceae bacterium]|jgi:hypothetical protein
MGLVKKILNALSQSLTVEQLQLVEEDGISGFVVSPRFQGMSALARQELIEEALTKGPDALTPKERRRVLMIAALTPVEYVSVGAHIHVHRIREMAGGTLEILLRGGLSDAEYVRGALNNQKGVQTTKPKQAPGAAGTFMSFQAKGTEATPLTKARAIRVLKNDPYIEVMPNS